MGAPRQRWTSPEGASLEWMARNVAGPLPSPPEEASYYGVILAVWGEFAAVDAKPRLGL